MSWSPPQGFSLSSIAEEYLAVVILGAPFSLIPLVATSRIELSQTSRSISSLNNKINMMMYLLHHKDINAFYMTDTWHDIGSFALDRLRAAAITIIDCPHLRDPNYARIMVELRPGCSRSWTSSKCYGNHNYLIRLHLCPSPSHWRSPDVVGCL